MARVVMDMGEPMGTVAAVMQRIGVARAKEEGATEGAAVATATVAAELVRKVEAMSGMVKGMVAKEVEEETNVDCQGREA